MDLSGNAHLVYRDPVLDSVTEPFKKEVGIGHEVPDNILLRFEGPILLGEMQWIVPMENGHTGFDALCQQRIHLGGLGTQMQCGRTSLE